MDVERSNPRFPVVGLVASLVLIGSLLACGGAEPEAREQILPPPVEVELATVERVALGVGSQVTGSVRALRQVAPGTKILGRVEAVPVREGERVSQGALLARLESRDLEAAVDQAQAAVTMAEAQLENARAQRDRMVTLHERGSVTEKNLEDAVAAFRVAEAALEQAQANLAAARVTLGYAEVRSPMAGWLVEKRIEAGDMASPGRPLFVVEDLSRIEVEAQVPEADIVDLERGDEAQVTILGREYPASVDRVVRAADSASRTFVVKLLLDNPEGRLRSGMFARVRFPGNGHESLTVEPSAVVHRGQLDGVYVAGEDGLLRLRWVKLGREVRDRIEVLSGLEPGERYVVAPPPGVVDGTPYRAGATTGGGA